MRQISDHQRALLGVLLLHPCSTRELRERWPYARRTIRSAFQRGLVRIHGKNDDWVQITDAGKRYFGTPEETAGLGGWR